MKNTVQPIPATETYVPPDPDPKRQRVLELLVLGNSVSAAMNAVDMHRRSFYYWCKSDPAYAALANRARNIHIADIDDALHEVDADARALVHRIIIDENLTASVRLRAAITALTRKGPGWLPRELPPYEHGPRQSQIGEQSDAAAKSPQGASKDSPGRKAGERQPSEARPPQPPAASTTPGAKVTLITKAKSRQCENANTVQTVQTIGRTEPGSPDSELPPSKPQTEPWSSGQGPGSSSRTNEKPLLQGEQSDATARSPQGGSNDSPGRKAGENQPSEARPPQPHLSQDTPGATVAARIGSLITKQPAANTPQDFGFASASSAAPREDSPNPRPHTPDSGGDETMRIDAAFLSKYTILRHESHKDFAQLLREMTAIYEPQSKPEELQVLRITQAHWNLRRIETMQTAFLESTVDRVRCEVPDAHPAAAIAAASLGEDRTDQVWFLDRMQHYRKFHEEHLSRVEGLLFRYKEAREVSAVRDAKRRSLTRDGNARTLSQPDRRCILHENLELAFQATLVEETQSLTEALARPQ